MNIDDLLFKSRNKDYGAYYLRKKYFITVIVSLIITVILVFIFLVLPLFMTARNQNKNEFSIKIEITPAELSLIENLKENEPKIEKPKIEKSLPAIENKVETLPNIPTDSLTKATQKNDTIINNKTTQTKRENIDPRLQETAQFNCGNGLDGFRDWFTSNFQFVQNKKKISGKLLIQFRVNTLGIIDSVAIIHGIYAEYDNEAKDLLLKSPRWSPCMIKNRKVNMLFNLPIYIISK